MSLVWSLRGVSIVSLWVLRPVLANGFVDWDDHIYLAELARMGRFSWSSLRWMWTSLQPFYLQPIVWMTHLADYQIWGLNPIGHHATNWLLHGVYVGARGHAGVAADREGRGHAARGTAGDERGDRAGVRDSSVAGGIGGVGGGAQRIAVFAVDGGGVVRVRARGRRRRANENAVGGGRRWRCSAVALLTKPFAVSLPVVMLAVDFFPLRRHVGRSAWRLVGEKWLMIALSGAAAVGAIAAQRSTWKELSRTR